MKNYSNLQKIYQQKGIELHNEDGSFRHVVDVLEDIYIKLNSSEFIEIGINIMEEEKNYNLFDEARGRPYCGPKSKEKKDV